VCALALTLGAPAALSAATGGTAASGGPAGLLGAVACPSASCVAVGARNGTTLIAQRWNGKKWATVPINPPPAGYTDRVDDVACTSATHCFGVGLHYGPHQTALLEQWDGKQWVQRIAPQPPGSKGAWLTGVSCPSATFCMASGVYDRAASQRSYSAAWNGSAWTVTKIPKPADASVMSAKSVSCADPSTCFLVGRIVKATTQTLVMQWHGNGWTRKPSPTPSGPRELSLTDVACPTSGFCFAVGDSVQSLHHRPFAVRWIGQHFSLMTATVPQGSDQNVFDDVACASPVFCVTVGNTSLANGIGYAWTKRWDGKHWADVATPQTGVASALYAASCPTATSCTAVGVTFPDGVNDPHTLAMRWNGKTWTIAAPPAGGS
jgi:hypothetical protein